jgi:hypothetical protein
MPCDRALVNQGVAISTRMDAIALANIQHIGNPTVCVCVFITAGPSTKLFTWGGGGYGRTCATRDDEPRPVWTRLPITH